MENAYSNQQTSNLLQFSWQLQKDGSSNRTISNYSKFLEMLVRLGARLCDGESVKSTIALQSTWSSSTKVAVVSAYRKYATMNNIQWNAPKYQAIHKLPFIPTEAEIDQLIAYCGKKTSTILQLLKETGMRIGEALSLNWTDINFESRILLLNNPEKHSNARQFKLSEKCCE